MRNTKPTDSRQPTHCIGGEEEESVSVSIILNAHVEGMTAVQVGVYLGEERGGHGQVVFSCCRHDLSL